VKFKRINYRNEHLKQPVVDALADTLVEEEAKKQDDILGDMDTQTLVEA